MRTSKTLPGHLICYLLLSVLGLSACSNDLAHLGMQKETEEEKPIEVSDSDKDSLAHSIRLERSIETSRSMIKDSERKIERSEEVRISSSCELSSWSHRFQRHISAYKDQIEVCENCRERVRYFERVNTAMESSPSHLVSVLGFPTRRAAGEPARSREEPARSREKLARSREELARSSEKLARMAEENPGWHRERDSIESRISESENTKRGERENIYLYRRRIEDNSYAKQVLDHQSARKLHFKREWKKTERKRQKLDEKKAELAKELEEQRENMKKQSVLFLLRLGKSVQEVAQASGLSIDEITKLKSDH